MNCLGILAGSGQFPFLVARGARSQGYKVVACGFHNNTDLALADAVDSFIHIPLGKLSTLIDFFKAEGVQQVCMAGAIHKPSAFSIKPDYRAAKLIFRLLRNRGDDAILRGVAEELSSEGMQLVRPEQFAPHLSSPEGLLSARQPSAELWQNIHYAWQCAEQFSLLDVGQCLVVKESMVIAVEAIEGTNATLERAGQLAGEGCVAIKRAKKNQDTRLDLPAFGLQTMEILHKYKYSAFAYEAGKTLFFDQEASIQLANTHKISLVGIPSPAASFFEPYLPNKEE